MTAGPPQRSVADEVGEAIAAAGAQDAFGVIGSGNLVVTNALCRGGARFHHARHEGGAIVHGRRLCPRQRARSGSSACIRARG